CSNPSATSRLPKPRSNTMLPRTSSIWQRDSHPTASGKPGAVHKTEDEITVLALGMDMEDGLI
ncbi:hypothetical protein, partial [Sphingomonas koreensis]|uniref:hypothetical protein n=1 Tax=Sphingomonas koreensis TaxID=93064 RepID=UPI0019D1FCD2